MHAHRHSMPEKHRGSATAAAAHAHVQAPGPADRTARHALWLALVLTGGFGIVEATGGWLAGSLALLSDAGHMFTDAAALGLALFAHWIARRPPSRRASYGYARAEVLAAFVNALALIALVVFIVVEAVRRLLDPQPVAGAMVLGIAAAGALVNLVVRRDPAARRRLFQRARGAAACAVGSARLARCGGCRHGHRAHRLDADRPDPFARRFGADRALDVASARAIHRRVDGRRSIAS